MTITSGSSGTGSGTVNYSVSTNTSPSARTGNMTVAGKTFTITQAGAGGTITLGEALDNTSLTWTTSGNASWYGQTTTYYYGGSAAQSGAITHNQITCLQTTVTGPGTLSFYWKVSSEKDYDYLYFYIDDILKSYISGETSWEQKTFSITAGSHTLKWCYYKDSSDSSGLDAGWVDYMRYTPSTVCTYSINPTSQSFSASGGTGSVSVTTQSGCSWTAVSNVSWITITSGSSGTDSDTVTYAVAANTSTSSRTGTMTIAGQTFTVTQAGAVVISLGEALDNTSLQWNTFGDATWFGQTQVYYYGGDAAKSGAISYDQWSIIWTTVTGPGTLSFYWKVSSEANKDFLRFYIDGNEIARISGEVDWQQKTYSIPSGSHTLIWSYQKDHEISHSYDAGWLDKVEFTPISISSVRLLRPNGGEKWNAGSRYVIKWEAPLNSYKFTLRYSTDNKATWTNIATVLASNRCTSDGTKYTCTYGWTIPAQDGRKVQSFVRVVAIDSANQVIGSDDSDKAFVIEVLKLTSPNGGETLTVGSIHTITWQTYALTKTVARVQLQYTTNNGQTWINIATVTGNPGQYNWRVPNTPSNQCRVRVILRDGAGAEIARDISDNVFTIEQ